MGFACPRLEVIIHVHGHKNYNRTSLCHDDLTHLAVTRARATRPRERRVATRALLALHSIHKAVHTTFVHVLISRPRHAS